MAGQHRIRAAKCCSFCLIAAAVAALALWGKQDRPGETQGPSELPLSRFVGESEVTVPPLAKSDEARTRTSRPPPVPGNPPAEKHPLKPALEWAESSLKHIEQHVADYTATLVKHERVGKQLAEPQEIFLKVRHPKRHGDHVTAPFAVYLRFQSPDSVRDREVIYVEDRNDGKLLVQESPHTLTGKLVGTVALDPSGVLAMRGNRYPITEIGIHNLMKRLVETARQELQHGECQVTIDDHAVFDGTACRLIEVNHPRPRPHFRYHLARIHVDPARQVPLAYESFDWPKKAGAPAPLIERYAYKNLKLNVKLTDRDFDTSHRDYSFK